MVILLVSTNILIYIESLIGTGLPRSRNLHEPGCAMQYVVLLMGETNYFRIPYKVITVNISIYSFMAQLFMAGINNVKAH